MKGLSDNTYAQMPAAGQPSIPVKYNVFLKFYLYFYLFN